MECYPTFSESLYEQRLRILIQEVLFISHEISRFNPVSALSVATHEARLRPVVQKSHQALSAKGASKYRIERILDNDEISGFEGLLAIRLNFHEKLALIRVLTA